MLCFFLQPLAFGGWLPRIPEIQQRLGLGPADLALALLGLPAGLLLMMPFAGPLVARIGGRATVRIFLPAFLVAMSLPAFSLHPVMLFGALLLCGVTMSMIELGMNIVADEIERRDGVAIMSRSHGFWSFGMMAGSLIGVALAGAGVAPQWSILAVAAIVIPIGYLVSTALPYVAPSKAEGEGSAVHGLFVPGWLLLGICIVALGSNLLEGAAADWSAVYMTSIFAADPATAGLGYSAYALMMALGRFAGDYLRSRFGPVLVVRTCYSVALVGTAMVVFTDSYAVAIIGFALAGLGGSVAVPLAVSAAAGAGGGRPAASNVAMVSLISLIGFLLTPPIIGFIGEHFGLRAGLGVLLLPMLALGILLAGTVKPRKAGATG
jgi:MFS family permease